MCTTSFDNVSLDLPRLVIPGENKLLLVFLHRRVKIQLNDHSFYSKSFDEILHGSTGSRALTDIMFDRNIPLINRVN